MRKMRERSGFVWAVVIVLGVTLLVGESARAGRLVAWGQNIEGQCDVPSGTDFVAISAQWKHSLALRADGSIAAWGQNNWDQAEPPAGTDFVAVAAGGFSFFVHAVALRGDGSLAAWGDNSYEQCDVPSNSTFTAVAVGAQHTVALRADGSLVAWGRNGFGQCDVPTGNNFVDVAAGSSHCLALMKNPEMGPPLADAGPDVVAGANEEIVLDAGNSADRDGYILLYTWKRLPDDVVIYSGTEPTCTTRALGRAEEIIELTVTDNDSLTSSDMLTIFNRMLQDLRDQIDGL